MIKLNNLSQLDALLQENPLSIVYISMPQCSVCVSVKPQLIEAVAPLNVPIYQLDAHETPAVASRFQVLTAPAVLLFDHDKEIQRQARFIDFKKIQKMIGEVQQASAVSYEELFQ